MGWLVDLFTTNHELAHYDRSGGRAAARSQPDSYKTIAVIGGGTAGFLTALALRAQLPHLDVTLIESSSIPIIGVGEATVPSIVWFLHKFLNIDIHDFYAKVKPTWKQGIKFEWGQPGDYHFQAPFDWEKNSIGVLGSLKYDGNTRAMTIQSMMMDHDVTPILRVGDDNYLSFIHNSSHAYHLDNVRLVRYLHQAADAAGVKYMDRKIADVVVSPDGTEIEQVITDQGERLAFDLYFDCTGFRSLLLEQKLGSPFISYADSLFTDRALVFNAPHGGRIKPYTTAKTMNSGWTWIIPQVESDHNGYVHCSAFCSEEEAAREAREKFPGMSDPHSVVKFRSGRHKEMWSGNVIAVGNAYGFVEPLESTGLLMICETIFNVIRMFPSSKHDVSAKRLLNEHHGNMWDGLRWFLSVHYKFNQKLSTPFWREVWEKTDISGAQPLLDAYRELGPLHFRNTQEKDMLRRSVGIVFYGLAGFDCILLGQRVPSRLFELTESRAAWQERKDLVQSMVPNALRMEDALRVVLERPELLTRVLEDPNSWVYQEVTPR